MFNWLKRYVISKTIQYAESRYSIFVWMRMMNERTLRLENGEVEQAVQQRAEMEAFFDSKIQKIEASVGLAQAHVEALRMDVDKLIGIIEGMQDGV